MFWPGELRSLADEPPNADAGAERDADADAGLFLKPFDIFDSNLLPICFIISIAGCKIVIQSLH